MFARYAKYDTYYTVADICSLGLSFARYAKYDTYYTNLDNCFVDRLFARYAKYDTYYTQCIALKRKDCLLGMLNMILTIPSSL